MQISFHRFSPRFYVNLRNGFSGKKIKKNQKTGIPVKTGKVTCLTMVFQDSSALKKPVSFYMWTARIEKAFLSSSLSVIFSKKS